MDLPQFTVMPAGLDDWDRIWAPARRHPPHPRAATARRGPGHARLPGQRAATVPVAAEDERRSNEGDDLGVPARVFPQWLRCTGCDLLGPLTKFDYRNTHPYRTDLAGFEHVDCPGRRGPVTAAARPGAASRPAVPARYLLACVDGHPTSSRTTCGCIAGRPARRPKFPALKMTDRHRRQGRSPRSTARRCGLPRPMNEAQGEGGRLKLPRCRGRHPHLDAFEPGGCGNESRLMLVGASNLWFATTQSMIVMPDTTRPRRPAGPGRPDQAAVGDELADYRGQPKFLRNLLAGKVDVADLSDAELMEVLELALAPAPSRGERLDRQESWDPIDLLVPEWSYLQRDPLGAEHDDPSGLTLSTASAGSRPAGRDHPGARGRQASQGQRADRVHPDRRHGPSQ